jgi:O-antigen ligase
MKWATATALVLATSLYGFGSATALKWAAVYLIAAFAVALFVRQFWKTGVVWADNADAALVLLLAWCAGSLLWSADPAWGGWNLLNIGALACVFWLFKNENVKGLEEGALGTIIAALVLNAVWPEDWGGHGNPNFFAEIILIATPLALAAKPRPLAWAVVFVALGYTVDSVPSNLPLFVMVGMFAIGVAVLRRWFLAMLVVAVIAAACKFFASNVLARLELWINSLAGIAEAPFEGHGLGSFNAVYDQFREAHYAWMDRTILSQITDYPGAAHNLIVQATFEIGLAGLALLAIFLVLTLWRCRRDWPALATLAVGALLCMVEFPEQNPASGLLLAAALGRVSSLARHEATCDARAVSAAGVAFVAALAIAGTQFVRAERAFAVTLALASTQPVPALAANFEANRLAPWHRGYAVQMPLTLRHVMVLHPVEMDTRTADLIAATAFRVAPDMPSLLLLRGQYLLTAGRLEPELADITRRMMRSAGHRPSTWLLGAHYALAIDDEETAALAVKAGLSLAEDLNTPFLRQLAQALEVTS